MKCYSRIRFCTGGSVFAACMWLFVTPVSADTIELIDASFIESASVYNTHMFGTSPALAESVFVNPVFDRGTGSAFAGASGVLPVTAEVSVMLQGADSPAAFGGSGSIQIQFQFAIVPLDDGLPDTVPIDFSAAGFVSVDASAALVGSQTYAMIDFPGGQWRASNCDALGCYNGTFAFDETADLMLLTSNPFTVTMNVLSHGQGGGLDFSYDAYAFLDPLIAIDPDFEFRDQYQIIYSAGINPVPLPASVLLMLSGLVILAGPGYGRFRLKKGKGGL